MKHSILVLVIAIFLLNILNACGSETGPADGESIQETSAIGETETEKEELLYTAPEDLADADGIISVEKVEVMLPDGVDISALPAEVQEMYHGILEMMTYQILYTVDDCKVSAFLSVPADYLQEMHPLLLYNRGGNANFSANTAADIASYAYMADCVVMASNYRETDPGTGKDEFGGADVHDVIFLMDLANKIGFIDRDRIYMLGESRGGMQTCLALLEDTENVICAAACVSGIYDLADMYESREDMRKMLTYRVGGTPDECPEEYSRRSVVDFTEKIHTPLLLIHSTGDEKVPYAQAAAFAAELEKYGKTYEFRTRENKIHSMSSPAELQEIISWMEENAVS